MTTTTTTTTSAAGPAAAAPRLSDLLASEWLRARSRRSLRWLTVLGLLVVAGIATILLLTTARTSQADIDQAVQRFMVEQQMYYEQCLNDPSLPVGERDQFCFMPSEADARSSAYWMLDRQPFAQEGMVGFLGFAGGAGAVICLMLGATAGGADWGARTMGLLLSWEPRRLRVFVVRLSVVAVVALVVQAVLVGMALGLGSAIAGQHGLNPGLHGIDAMVVPVDLQVSARLALRWLVVGGLAGAAAFGVAMAARSTGWAIGASAGFLIVAESLVQALWPWGSQWLVQTNAIAWLNGGIQWTVSRGSQDSQFEMVQGTTIWLSQGRAVATLGAMVLIVLAVAGLMLRIRDVD